MSRALKIDVISSGNVEISASQEQGNHSAATDTNTF